MVKIAVALGLFFLFAGYSVLIYTTGTEQKLSYSEAEQNRINLGKQLYQQYNCQSCHQIYGLGGYLGPELTTAYSDKSRGENYLRAMLKSGGARMPDFHLSSKEIDAFIAYLKYVDTTASPVKAAGYRQ